MPRSLCGESFSGDTDDEKISCHSVNSRRQRVCDLRAKQQLEHHFAFEPHPHRRAEAVAYSENRDEVFQFHGDACAKSIDETQFGRRIDGAFNRRARRFR